MLAPSIGLFGGLRRRGEPSFHPPGSRGSRVPLGFLMPFNCF